MVMKVHGGILTDRSLSGGLHHFIMSGIDFGYVVSDGTITLPSSTTGGNGETYYKLVDVGRPVPESSVEKAFSVLSEKATIQQIGLIGITNTVEVHFSMQESSNGWINLDGTVDIEAIQDAVRAIGEITVPAPSGGAVGSNISEPQTTTVDMSGVNIQMVPYRLGRVDPNVLFDQQTVTLTAPEDRVTLVDPVESPSDIVAVVGTLKTDPQLTLNMKYVDSEAQLLTVEDYTLEFVDENTVNIVVNEELLRSFYYDNGAELDLIVFTAKQG